jgi:hypothetical protein
MLDPSTLEARPKMADGSWGRVFAKLCAAGASNGLLYYAR